MHDRLPPRHLDDAQVRAGLGEAVRDAVRALDDDAVIADGLGAMEEVLVRRSRCPPVGSVRDTVGVDGHTLVRKHQPLYAR